MFPIYWYVVLFTAIFSCVSEADVVITSIKSGLVFDGNEKNVKAAKPDNSKGQRWMLEPRKNGHFVIVNVKNKLALDVQKGCKIGTNIIVYKKHGNNNQQFSMNPDGTIGTNCTENLILYMKDGNVETGPKKGSCDLDVRFKFVQVQ